MDSTRCPIIGFLHPSEMTPEERTNELAAILAAGFLSLLAGMTFPDGQAKTPGTAAFKSAETTESSLEPNAKPRLCGSQNRNIL